MGTSNSAGSANTEFFSVPRSPRMTQGSGGQHGMLLVGSSDETGFTNTAGRLRGDTASNPHRRLDDTTTEMPTIQALQHSADIQRQVHQRYAELESFATQPQGTVQGLMDALLQGSEKN